MLWFTLALAITSTLLLVPIAHAETDEDTVVDSPDRTTQPAPAPAPTLVAPVDLNPRPLGQSRAADKPAKKTTSESVATPAPSAASTLLDNPIVRTTLSLGVVVGLIILLAAAYRKLGSRAGGLLAKMGPAGSAPAGILEILGRYPISRGQTLILLKLDRRILLLSQTTPRIRGGTGTLTTLAEVSDPEDVASILLKAQDAEGASNSARFQSLLGRFDSSHPADPNDHEHTTLSLRETHASSDGDRTELWDVQNAATTFPLVPPLADARTPAPAIQTQPQTDSFGSLRQRLSALNGEAHR